MSEQGLVSSKLLLTRDDGLLLGLLAQNITFLDPTFEILQKPDQLLNRVKNPNPASSIKTGRFDHPIILPTEIAIQPLIFVFDFFLMDLIQNCDPFFWEKAEIKIIDF